LGVHKLLCDGTFVDMYYVCMEACMFVTYVYVRVYCMYKYMHDYKCVSIVCAWVYA